MNALFALTPEQRRRGRRLAVAAQVLFVLAVAAAGYATDYFGHSVALRTAPVDARDLLYGDYVVLSFRIGQLDRQLWRGASPPRRHQPVYVELRPAPDGSYEAVAVHAAEPARVPAGHAVLRGWVRNTWRTGLGIRYGLEKYFVPEASRELLRKARRSPLLVHVRVAGWSQARITRVETLPAE
ncbi:GDYXXLXY domain-containing protein [Hymenobacter sp. B81]|uniref:GDYXXLXY domain-containing protein n=1 Tax=Hymenobacter sp. B81 TaxID=3344878 RepID=UPI0037DC3352